jgi:hypothetical protein
VAPRLHIAVVPDSVMVSAGRVGESFGAIRARVGLLASVDILMCFEVELGRETLTALRTDNRANFQVDGSNVPLHQTGTRLETALIPVCIIPNTLRLSAANPLDVVVGVDGRRGARSGGRLLRLVLGREGRRGRGRRCMRGTSSGIRVAGGIAVVTRARR